MLAIAGRHADGWWPTGSDGPEEYAAKLGLVRRAAEDAGRDPLAIVPAKMVVCLLGEADEIAEMLERPLVKSLVLQLTAELPPLPWLRAPDGRGVARHPGHRARRSARERLVELFDDVDVEAILSVVPHGTPERGGPRTSRRSHEAGLQVASILDYSGMAGQAFARPVGGRRCGRPRTKCCG